MKKKENGFTLIEVIVVIAIMAILISVTGLSIKFAYSKDCESAAKSIDSQLANLRSMTMNQIGNFKIRLTTLDDENRLDLYKDSVVIDTVELGKRVQISFLPDEVLHDADWVEIEFSKSNGKVLAITYSNGALTTLPAVFSFHIGNSSGKNKNVELVTLTGKHYVE